MAVTVILVATANTLNLQASDIRISLKRMPIQNAIPGGTIQMIDLSQLVTNITVSGKMPNTTAAVDTADLLRQAATSWDTSSPTLKLPFNSATGSAKTWTGQIDALELSQEAGQDGFFSYTLVFKCSTNSPSTS